MQQWEIRISDEHQVGFELVVRVRVILQFFTGAVTLYFNHSLGRFPKRDHNNCLFVFHAGISQHLIKHQKHSSWQAAYLYEWTKLWRVDQQVRVGSLWNCWQSAMVEACFMHCLEQTRRDGLWHHVVLYWAYMHLVVVLHMYCTNKKQSKYQKHVLKKVQVCITMGFHCYYIKPQAHVSCGWPVYDLCITHCCTGKKVQLSIRLILLLWSVCHYILGLSPWWCGFHMMHCLL